MEEDAHAPPPSPRLAIGSNQKVIPAPTGDLHFAQWITFSGRTKEEMEQGGGSNCFQPRQERVV